MICIQVRYAVSGVMVMEVNLKAANGCSFTMHAGIRNVIVLNALKTAIDFFTLRAICKER